MDDYLFYIGIMVCIGINIVMISLNLKQLKKLRQFHYKGILKIPIFCLFFVALYSLFHILFLHGFFIILGMMIVLESQLPSIITLIWQYRVNKIIKALGEDGKI
jgi:hypothetical protein